MNFTWLADERPSGMMISAVHVLLGDSSGGWMDASESRLLAEAGRNASVHHRDTRRFLSSTSRSTLLRNLRCQVSETPLRCNML